MLLLLLLPPHTHTIACCSVVVSPDAGGVYRAKKFREGLNSLGKVDAGLAMIIKQRKKAGQVLRPVVPAVEYAQSW